MKKSVLCLFLFLWGCVLTVFGQNTKQLNEHRIQKLNAVAMQDVTTTSPGMATAIIQNGKVVYQKVGGYANLKDSVLITPQTRFNLASNGKQFTALAILFLEQEKKINLSDDFRIYLPSLLVNYPKKITIAHLLNHSSGIRDVYDLWALQGLTWWEKTFSNAEVITLLEKQDDLNFESGTDYLYSNSNYILLAQIIEKVSGQTFVNYTTAMFDKLGMPNTFFVNDYNEIAEPIAQPYFNFSTWQTFPWQWNVSGDGNLFSTLEDQLHWEKLLQTPALQSVHKAVLQKSQQFPSDSGSTHYGFGLERGVYKGMDYLFHEGATGAWKATILRFPSHHCAMITLTNSGKAVPYDQTRQMADVFFELDKTPTFLIRPAAEGPLVKEEEILGYYSSEQGFFFRFEQQEGTLFLKRTGRNDVVLQRESNNSFQQLYDPDFKLEFAKNKAAEMQVTAYYTSHAPYSLTRTEPNWNGFQHASVAGKYRNPETDVTMELTWKEKQLYSVSIGNHEPRTGILLMPTRLVVDNYTFEVVKESGATTLLLHSDRIKKVRFNALTK